MTEKIIYKTLSEEYAPLKLSKTISIYADMLAIDLCSKDSETSTLRSLANLEIYLNILKTKIGFKKVEEYKKYILEMYEKEEIKI